MTLTIVTALVALALGGLVLEFLTARVERARIGMPGKRYRVQGGWLHVDVRGQRADAGAPAIILDGGLTVSGLAWPAVAQALGNEFLTITVDRAGHGWSDSGPLPRSAARNNDDLAALLAAAQVPPPYIYVAHSYAGSLARLYAHRHPKQMAGLILVETTPLVLAQDVVASAWARSFRWKQRLAQFGVWRLWRWVKQRPAKLVSLSPETMQTVWQRLSQSGKDLRASAAEIAQFLPAARAADEAGPLGDLPLVVIASMRGAVVVPSGFTQTQAHARALAVQRKLAGLSRRSSFIATDCSDHEIPWHEPELIAAAVRDITRQQDNKANHS